tara:strand:+ start:814 stop:3288 length:2475 start_codon:yes stop_codon:yes gene_type:complete
MNMLTRTAAQILSTALPLAFAAPSVAQCATTWLPTNLGFATNGAVYCLQSWDVDGNGPLAPTVAIGGSFNQVGSSATDNLAFYDPATQTFSAPTASPNGAVHATVDLGNGQLIVAGNFSSVGGVAGTSGIAVWDGTSWSSLGGGVQGQVFAVTRLANGDLLVGGFFTTAGSAGLVTNSIARWDGVAWQALGTGVTGSTPAVRSLIERSNGDIIVGGSFSNAGGVAAQAIASWNGSSWQAFNSGVSVLHLSFAQKLLVRANGSMLLLASGFGSQIYEYTNGTWTAMAGAPGNAAELFEAANGVLYVGQRGNILVSAGVHALQQGVWTNLASSSGPSQTLSFAAIQSLPGGNPSDLIIGGSFQNVNGVASQNLGTLVGGTWSGSGSASTQNIDGAVLGFATASDGTVYACGEFTSINGTPVAHIAYSNGSSWQPMGSGMNQVVTSIAVAANGDVYAVGQFTTAGGVACPGFARWDGTSWSAVAGFNAVPAGILTRRNGNLVTWGSWIGIQELTANGWMTILPSGHVAVMVELPDGRLAASGQDQQWGPGTPMTRTAIWDGTTWETTTYQHSQPNAIGFDSNGDVVVSAPFNPPFQGQNVARWDGLNWQSMAAGLPSTPTSFATLPSGELIASGYFDGLAANASLASFDGTAWTPLPSVATNVRSLHFSPTGALFAGGGTFDPSIHQLTSSCPAAVVSTPSGCAGPQPSPQLQTAHWPYLGTDYHAYVTNVQAGSLLLSAYGLTNTNLLLSNLLPSAVSGCLLLTDPLFLIQATTQNGSAATQLSFPVNNALVGMSFHQQIAALAFNQGTISSTQTSNALQLTIGSF